VSVRYVELADYVAIAAEVTGLKVETILKVADLGLADSALHAPAAEFDETEFYPGYVDKAAVLVVRLTKNHPLPDGNKRAAWVALRLFVDVNGWSWSPMPTVDASEAVMLAIAAGEMSEAEVAVWLREHLSPSEREV
jgi:death on curing protein